MGSRRASNMIPILQMELRLRKKIAEVGRRKICFLKATKPKIAWLILRYNTCFPFIVINVFFVEKLENSNKLNEENKNHL